MSTKKLKRNYQGTDKPKGTRCESCGGVLAKLQGIWNDRDSANNIRVRHLSTPFHYCMKCEKIVKISIKQEVVM